MWGLNNNKATELLRWKLQQGKKIINIQRANEKNTFKGGRCEAKKAFHCTVNNNFTWRCTFLCSHGTFRPYENKPGIIINICCWITKKNCFCQRRSIWSLLSICRGFFLPLKSNTVQWNVNNFQIEMCWGVNLKIFYYWYFQFLTRALEHERSWSYLYQGSFDNELI